VVTGQHGLQAIEIATRISDGIRRSRDDYFGRRRDYAVRSRGEDAPRFGDDEAPLQGSRGLRQG
jgi:hypothetical protein